MMLHIRPLVLVAIAALGASACDHTRIADESHEITHISFRSAPPPPDRSSLPGFLRVSSGGFVIDAAPFTLLGANAWNLTKPGMTQAAIRDVLEKAATYGFNTVRTWAYREFEDPGFTNFDLVLSEAQRAGLKVVFVLTDNWNHFPSVSTPYGPLGGADAFVFECAGEIPAPKGNAEPLTHEMFFTEDCPRRKYQEWVEKVVPRYRDNPTLAAWELINEPRCSGTDQSPVGGLPTTSKPCAKAIEEWVDHFSRFLAGLDRNHLISVGDEGYPRKETQVGVNAESISSLPSVHFLTLHYYLGQGRKLTYGQTLQELGRVATRVGKPFVMSEFGLPSSAGRACQYSAWIGELSKVAGSGGWLFWQLMDPSSSDSDEYAELGWNPAIGVLSQAARAGSAGSILELDCRVEGLTVKVSEEGTNIPVANATVELWPGTDQNFLPIAVMTTDASGSASQFGLVPGEYTLAVEALGYQGPETAVVHIRHASSNVFTVILKPNEVNGDLVIKSIAVGYRWVCALYTNGEFGCTATEEILPRGTLLKSTDATPRFESLTAGASALCGITPAPDNTAYCWGGGWGPEPTPLPGWLKVKQVAFGFQNACVLTTQGHVYCWGNDLLALGFGVASSAVPLRIPDLDNHPFVEIALQHTPALCGISSDGQATCRGQWIVSGGIAGPTDIVNSDYVQLASQFYYYPPNMYGVCGLRGNGTVDCWASHMYPPQPMSAAPIIRLARSLGFSGGNVCGIDQQGRAHCMGPNSGGELARPGSQHHSYGAFLEIPYDFRFKELGVGYMRVCGLRVDGDVVCWGGPNATNFHVPWVVTFP